jgi:SAM-dependent methyltransferase
MTIIEYGLRQAFPGHKQSVEFFAGLIAREGARTVLEVGAGANPTLPRAALAAVGDVRYVVNDVDPDELAKAEPGYDTLVGDMSAPGWKPPEPFDLIFSRMVNEHVPDGETYYGNLFHALRPGGLTVHCFSTLYALPFVANRVMPERVSDALLQSAQHRRDFHHHGKFRAYYAWSRGPTRRNIRRFESVGFVVERYDGYFGHGYYGGRSKLLQSLERAKSQFLVRHPNPHLTAYAMVQLRRPN